MKYWFENQDWLSDLVKVVAGRIIELGGHPYLVGGAVRARVREEVTGVKEGIKDFDVASDLDVDFLLEQGVPGTTTVNLGRSTKYGVVAFARKYNPGSHHSDMIEVARLRCDKQVGPKRTDVEVEFTNSIVEDLRRRDMPFNAMAYDLETGEFFDPFDGKGSITSGVAMATDDPRQCYLDDPLRMVRFFRFACRYDMEYDPATMESMSDPDVHDRLVLVVDEETGEESLAPAGFNHLSGERVGDEFTKILSLKPAKAARAFRSMMEAGLLDKWLPEVVGMRYYKQDPKWHSHDVAEHTFMAMAAFDPFAIPEKFRRLYRVLGLWSLLLHDTGKPVVHKATGKFHDHDEESGCMAEEVFDRLVLSRFFNKDQFLFFIKKHMTFLNEGRNTRMLARSGVMGIDDKEEQLAHLELVYAIRRADHDGRSFDLPEEKEASRKVYEKIKDMIENAKVTTKKELPVNGRDVLALEKEVAKEVGRDPRKPLKWVGEVLDQVFDSEVDLQAEASNRKETPDEVRERLLNEIRRLLQAA